MGTTLTRALSIDALSTLDATFARRSVLLSSSFATLSARDLISRLRVSVSALVSGFWLWLAPAAAFASLAALTASARSFLFKFAGGGAGCQTRQMFGPIATKPTRLLGGART